VPPASPAFSCALRDIPAIHLHLAATVFHVRIIFSEQFSQTETKFFSSLLKTKERDRKRDKETERERD
jgi:hypothetical protein